MTMINGLGVEQGGNGIRSSTASSEFPLEVHAIVFRRTRRLQFQRQPRVFTPHKGGR